MPPKSRRDKVRFILDTEDMIFTAIMQTCAHVTAERNGDDPLDSLSHTQLHAAMVLRRLEPCSLSVLARMLHVSPASASLMVDRLVERGVAVRERDTADRRRIIIRLTPKVQDWVEEVGESLCAWFEEKMNVLDRSVLDDWYALMKKVHPVIETSIIKSE